MSHFLWILLVCHVTLVLGQDVPLDLTQSLLSMIQDEKSLSAQLENELATMSHDLTMLQNQLTASPYCPGKSQPVAFSAALTNDIRSFGVRQQVHFDEVITNIGNAYDKRHGEFRAPVNGTYEFTVTMAMEPGHWAGVELMKDGVSVGKIKTGDAGEWTMASTTVTIEMMAGEDVWVEHNTESDSNVFYGRKMSTFSGHLIRF